MNKHLADRQKRQGGPPVVGAVWSWPQGELSKRGKRTHRFDEPFIGIPTRIFEASLCFGLTKREGRVFSALCRKTYGWGKKKDRISYSQIAELTGLHETHVGRVMRNLREARVLICEGDPTAGEALIWGVQERIELWDLPTLKRLRKEGRERSSPSKGEPRGWGCEADGYGIPRAKMALPPRAETALPTQSQNGSTQKILLKKHIKKNSAADAAVSLDQSQKGEESGLGDGHSCSSLEDQSDVGLQVQRPTKEQLAQVAHLCEELRNADLNPDVWVAHKARDGISIILVIKVLEQAVKQKEIVHNFWPWAEDVLAKVGEQERIIGIEREHEQRKVEFAQSVEEILEQVALRALSKQRDGEKSPDPSESDGKVMD